MFKFEDIKYNDFNLKIMQSDIFEGELLHLFSTRLGGDTPKPLQSFTLSAKDYTEYCDYAIKNAKIACEILNSPFENLIYPNQQHTDEIAIIKGIEDTKMLSEKPFDGIVTDLKNFPVMLVFADCIPVLLFDKKKNVLACVHAGWKGTAKGIVTKAVNIMVEQFGTSPNDINAAIGAGICQKCFEVTREVSDRLAMSIKNACGNIFLTDGSKVHVDLKLLNKIQLNEVGVNKVDVCEYCTSCNNDLFYSYRADNKVTGRHGMIAMIKE